MTYQETLDWMFGQLPMYQQKGVAAMNAKLDNIISFCNVLGNPEKKFKSIHVAGTNGKGSSSHMLASILQEAGYKVGLYTSPHLKDFRERIKINGKVVGEDFVVDFIEEYKPFLEYQKLSFFEMTVGMAFHYFAEEQVDIAVIEVGLGGRLDSTNIITPEVSLITNIGMDHTQFLGDTLEKIALEKAGIIKPMVPVVISETQAETKMIFNLIAHQLKSEIVFADEQPATRYTTDLLGEYQKKNINGVVAAISQLKGFDVPEESISKGLANVIKNTGLLGRWQILQQNPLVVCDTAHNKEGLQLVLNQVQKQTYYQLHIVLGFVSDKDVKSVLQLFPKEAHYYFVRPSIPRGLDVGTLEEIAKEQGLMGEKYMSVQQGFQKALDNADDEDMIYVGGSTFVVAEVV
ncbi:bifunctional folylpolyglutamate synthase/dihydrofolate synthase [Muricauda sp. HICW]|uniref:Dihydrofolate synthase/folylpolyglutamate synthase n=1 Tax=Flagellimonas chongwuensis TaxID=2697365 RepID=A0A850NB03_9FLAO|nr:folylpolyglutamate synthase/dihydrofolate synthase family protein [Allomuricauda chongwuensis]NVN17833.1 bifunctional folylpolyglutamate synthase/dihydrofolate synthase [Allomuricauda chongwuensis]